MGPIHGTNLLKDVFIITIFSLEKIELSIESGEMFFLEMIVGLEIDGSKFETRAINVFQSWSLILLHHFSVKVSTFDSEWLSAVSRTL